MSIRNRTTRRGLALIVALLLLPATLFAGVAGAASEGNHTPYFAEIPHHSIAEKAKLQFFVSAYDDDGDLLLYGAADLPAGATFDSARRFFSWTPGYDQQGEHLVTFTATDGRATGNTTAVITVVNHNFGPEAADVDAGQAIVGHATELQLVGTDFDGDALTYSSDDLFANATLDAATGVVTFTPGADQVGTSTMSYTVSDGALNATGTLTVTVIENQPVLVEDATASIRANGTLELTLVAADPEGSAVTFASTELPAGATLDAATGAFAWTTSFEDVGEHVISFTASDEVQATTGTLTLTVVANALPEIAPVEAATVIVNRTLTIQLSATDADSENLTFVAGRIPASATLNETTGVFSWTPVKADIGSHSFTFNVTDGESQTEGTIDVEVLANPAPVVRALIVPSRADVLNPVRLSVLANDPEGTNVTIEWDLDFDTTFTADATGSVVTHAFTRLGEHTVVVRITDADGSQTLANATILVDDAIVLTLEVLEAPGDAFTATLARVSLKTWNGSAVAGATIDLVSFHLPGTGSATTMREFTTTTGEDGTMEFFIPRDTAVANLLGNHLLRGTVTVGAGSDAESGFHAVRYVIA